MRSNPSFREEGSKIEEKEKHFVKNGWRGGWVKLLKKIIYWQPQATVFCDKVWFIRNVLKSQYIWIELIGGFAFQLWSKFNNLFAFFVTWDMLFIWHSLRDCKNVERVLNEEIVSEIWKKVRYKKLWKEEQMVKVQKSFNQVNNPT